MNGHEQFDRRTLLKLLGGAAAAPLAAGSATATSPEHFESLQRTDLEPIPTTDVTPDDVDIVSAVPEPDVGIRPGSAISSDAGGCTANFIWRPVPPEDASAGKPTAMAEAEAGSLYIGTAGHCLLRDGNATKEASRPDEDGEDVSDITVAIDVDGTFGLVVGALEAVELGEVVYARQTIPGDSVGIGHDFGLIRIPEKHFDMVDPSLPQFGGPDGTLEDGVPAGEPVHMYGNGNGNGEVFPTKGRYGSSLGETVFGDENAWEYLQRISGGDSGSPVIASQPGSLPDTGGAAAGVATHAVLGVSPPGVGTTIGRCKELVKNDLGLEIELVSDGDL